MFGYIVYAEEERRGALSVRTVLGLPMLEAVVPGRRLLGALSARRLAAAMAKAGVRQAVFPRDFPYGEHFVRRGILPVETLALYRQMAPLMVRHRMGQLGLSPSATTAAVSARRLSGAACEIVRAMALQVRYVMLAVEEGGEELCRELKREYGVSVLLRPGARQLAEAQVQILLDPPERPPAGGEIVLHLYDGERVLRRNDMTFGLPPALRGQVEENCEIVQLLAVLRGTGLLKNEQIPILDVDIPGKTHYNASIVNNIE